MTDGVHRGRVKFFNATDLVEFRYEPAEQDSWRYRATWVRKL